MAQRQGIVPALLLLMLLAACAGGGESRPSPTGARDIARPGAVPTATPWPSPPPVIFVDGSPEATPRPPGATPVPPGRQSTYTVQAGDTLSAIAARFSVDLQELIRLNNVTDPTRLAVGQVLTIPGARVGTTPAPRPATPTPTPRPGTATPTPRPGQCGDNYIVEPGDYPGLIAQKCGVDVAELLRINNITDPTTLRVGQELRIPRR